MEALSLRQLKESDIKLAHESTIIEGWNYRKEDIERMFKYNPLGCFIAEIEDKLVGHVFSVRYGKLGWIGLLIVRTEYRGKGIGTLLMKKAMHNLSSCGVETVKLEAASKFENFYRKLGFIDEHDSLRFSRTTHEFTSPNNSKVKLLKRNGIRELAKFDAKYFGVNRIEVLTRLYDDYPEFCFISCAGPKIIGYIMCRKGERGYWVGPWVCSPENKRYSGELLAKYIETLGQDARLHVGVPAVNKVAMEIMQEFGFEQYSKSIRMRFGKKLETERLDGIFAIGGPEKG